MLSAADRAPFQIMEWDQLVDKYGTMALEYAPRLVGAIIVLFIGLRIIKLVNHALSRFIDARELDPTLKPFFKSIAAISLKVLLFITVIGMLGVQMTSFIALLGAGGIAVGMALSGTAGIRLPRVRIPRMKKFSASPTLTRKLARALP